ncbi:hypothetical protein HGA13_20535 [Nocardia speluncae]|uniref:DUF1902 domain-containing protein n=1 Tax=Nocardia speluncae TaxID=419477 RepID=A0A846XH18_9NOCA|nr:hypothetical protein [Nocardia speluncae]NKY35438.1 hypothetical protein [Nocardia speluncae]
MTTFEVRVRPDKDGWFVFAPAFGVGRFVQDEEKIPAVARGMIAACGSAPREFSVSIDTPEGETSKVEPLNK